jgi:hypothetical protein
MMDGDNDNDIFPFMTLAVAAASVVSKLEGTHDEKRSEDRCTGDKSEKEAKDQRDYVDQRLREISAFEERARGAKPRGRA